MEKKEMENEGIMYEWKQKRQNIVSIKYKVSTQASYSLFSLLKFCNYSEDITEEKYMMHHPGQMKRQDHRKSSRTILRTGDNDTSGSVMLRSPLHPFFVYLQC